MGQVSASGQKQPRSGATLDEPHMSEMFDAVAPVYDRLNTVMTLGIDGRWRRRALMETRLRAGDAALDACCGTGKLAALLAERVGPFGRVEGVDLSPVMVDRAAEAYHSLVQAHFQVGNALALPFADDEFDAATISFGLRNLRDFAAGFRELARVVRSGGRVICLELSLPPSRLWGKVYHSTFRHTAPLAARLLGGQGEAYDYLPGSLEGFPDADTLAAQMRDAGLVDVHYARMGTGVVCLHRGTVPNVPDARA
jgi:demethylmenaquinone methyltransferase/2-methoxy-6-polyprenyl-1,4-benzoquinol methylase